LEIIEVAIVQATMAGELPHSLDRVEFGETEVSDASTG